MRCNFFIKGWLLLLYIARGFAYGIGWLFFFASRWLVSIVRLTSFRRLLKGCTLLLWAWLL